MGEFKVGDEVEMRGTVTTLDGDSALLDTGRGRLWIRSIQLEHVPSSIPVTVRCNIGCEHPLTDFKTAQDRCAALGILHWGKTSLEDFIRLCKALAERGITAEQFREGLT